MKIKVRVKVAGEIDGAQRAVGERLSLDDAEAYRLADAGQVEILKVSAREEAQATAEKEQNEKDAKAAQEAEKQVARKVPAEKPAADKADKGTEKAATKAE